MPVNIKSMLIQKRRARVMSPDAQYNTGTMGKQPQVLSLLKPLSIKNLPALKKRI